MNLFRKKYSLNTMTVFSLLSVLYVYSIAVEGLLGEGKFYYIEPDPFAYINIILSMTLALISFWVGYILSGFKAIESGRFSVRASKQSSHLGYNLEVFVSIFTFAIVAVGFFFYRSQFYMSFSDYAGNVGITFSNSGYAFFKLVAYSLMAISSGLCLSRKKLLPLGILFGVSLFLLGLMTSDKDPMVLAVLSASTFTSIFRKKFGIPKYFAIIAAVVLLAYFSRVFSAYRGGVGVMESIHIAYRYFSFSNLDGGGPFYSILVSTNSLDSYLLGKSYIDQIINLVPRFIYPGERPPDIAVQFAMKEMASWTGGKGLGFSPLAEGYMNFGITGIAIQFFLVALLWGYIWKLLRRVLKRIANIDSRSFLVIYHIIGVYYLLLLFRSPALFFLKSMLYVFLPLICLLVIYNIITRALSNAS